MFIAEKKFEINEPESENIPMAQALSEAEFLKDDEETEKRGRVIIGYPIHRLGNGDIYENLLKMAKKEESQGRNDGINDKEGEDDDTEKILSNFCLE